MAISSAVWVEAVLGLNVQDGEATARVELRSPIAAFASLGSSEPWPSLALSTPADLRDTPAIDEFRTPPASVETTPPLPDRNPIVVQSPAKAKMAIGRRPMWGLPRPRISFTPSHPTRKHHCQSLTGNRFLDSQPRSPRWRIRPMWKVALRPMSPFRRVPQKHRYLIGGLFLFGRPQSRGWYFSPIPPSQDGQKWFDSRYK